MAESLEQGRLSQRREGRIAASVDGGWRRSQAELDDTELRRSRAFVDVALGQRRIYANECHGLCYPFLPADEFFDDRHFPWFAELTAATDAIRGELIELLKDPGEALRPYVRMESGIGENLW